MDEIVGGAIAAGHNESLRRWWIQCPAFASAWASFARSTPPYWHALRSMWSPTGNPQWALDVQSTGGEVTHQHSYAHWAHGHQRQPVLSVKLISAAAYVEEQFQRQRRSADGNRARRSCQTLLARLRDDSSMEGHLQRAVDLPNERYAENSGRSSSSESVFTARVCASKVAFANQGSVDFLSINIVLQIQLQSQPSYWST